MEININHQIKDIPENTSVEELLSSLHVSLKGTAVAVNQAVIYRSEWAQYILQPNDKITLIQATQGG